MAKARGARLARASFAPLATSFALVVGASLSGCGPTEVVVVVDTDIQTMASDNLQIDITSSESAGSSSASLFQLPITLGVTTKGQASTFDVALTLSRGNEAPGEEIDARTIARRNAMNVAFTKDEQRAVFVPLFAKCAGTGGTAFPNPLDPDCLDLVSPPTTPFDEDNLPRIPKTASP
jgi:hypothetical protein